MHGPVDAVYTRILRRILLHQTLLQGRVHFHYVRVLLVHAFVLRLGFLGVPGIYGCAGIRQSFVVLFHEGSELGGSLSLFRRRLRERALKVVASFSEVLVLVLQGFVERSVPVCNLLVQLGAHLGEVGVVLLRDDAQAIDAAILLHNLVGPLLVKTSTRFREVRKVTL
eukprot:COSAG04_NODE_16368_length_501_cov_1.139303_1_plen_167_part_11